MERTKELQLTNQLLESNIDQLAEKELFLKESIATKDKLISVISHDIITPLKFISMVSRISKKNPDMIDRSKLIESMNDIEFASEKLYNNAKNILNWMKLQNNKINPQLHHIAVHEYIDEISEPLKGMAEIKGIAIINHVNEEDIIITDRNIFMIILQNILTNAIKYTEKGRIQVSANRDFGKYTIVVEDTGIGMSKETLAEIDRIRMGEPGGLNKAPKKDTDIGNQLGYIIISDLLTMIGGDFKIVSFPGIGSKVSIILQQSESSSA
jgi:signal transduction histidine kinase